MSGRGRIEAATVGNRGRGEVTIDGGYNKIGSGILNMGCKVLQYSLVLVITGGIANPVCCNQSTVL